MRAPLLCFALLIGACCKDAPPAGIEGRWKQIVPARPPWVWDFRDNLATQSIVEIGVSGTWPYARRADTLFIGGDDHTPPRTWVLRFLGDGALEARQLPTSTPGIGQYFIFERL